MQLVRAKHAATTTGYLRKLKTALELENLKSYIALPLIIYMAFPKEDVVRHIYKSEVALGGTPDYMSA